MYTSTDKSEGQNIGTRNVRERLTAPSDSCFDLNPCGVCLHVLEVLLFDVLYLLAHLLYQHLKLNGDLRKLIGAGLRG